MEKINCHSGTKKEELKDFVEKYKGKKIEIHYENNIIIGWGDDDFFTYDTGNDKQYREIIEMIEHHYIHGIKLID